MKNKFIFMLLCVLGILGLVSCQENGGTTEPPVDDEIKYPVSDLPIINMEEKKSDMKLAAITIDASKAKTRFYLGEEFSSEGLVVTAYYREDSDSEDAQEIQKIVDKYAINTEYPPNPHPAG